METTALSSSAIQSAPAATQQTVGHKEEQASSHKRPPSQGQGGMIGLPEDRVTLSSAVLPVERKPSQPVSQREKAALLGSQRLTRFSVYG